MKNLALAAVASAAVIAGFWATHRPPRDDGPLLLVFNGATDDWTLLSPLAERPHPRTLHCLSLGRWPMVVGDHDGKLVAVDTQHRQIVLVPLDLVDRAAQRGCTGLDESGVQRVPLRARKVPGTARIIDGVLYVTYYSENLVERYRWPSLDFDGVFELAADRNLGVSDIAAVDGKLWITTTGHYCFARECPAGRIGSSQLFDVARERVWPYPSLTAANQDASSFAQHPAGTFVVMAGNFEGGYSSLQRLTRGKLDQEIELPRNAAAAEAVVLDERRLLVRQFHGDHLFVVDAVEQKLQKVLSFDGQRFEVVPFGAHPAAESPLPERPRATFQEILRVPGQSNELLLLDELGQQLVLVDTAQNWSVRKIVSLTDQPGNHGPSYARWVP